MKAAARTVRTNTSRSQPSGSSLVPSARNNGVVPASGIGAQIDNMTEQQLRDVTRLLLGVPPGGA